MPTENRPTSTAKIVDLNLRELIASLEQFGEGSTRAACVRRDTLDQIYALLAQLDQQRQIKSPEIGDLESAAWMLRRHGHEEYAKAVDYAVDALGSPLSNPEKLVEVPQGYMLAERSIWTEQQIEAALAGIALVRSTPGTTDRDLALAAIDAAQCKAPQICLSDLVQAQQDQDEPLALAIPDECPHLIVFDDTEVESLMFAGAGARWAALESWKTISTSWNAHLFVRVARNSRDDRNPCATATDPAEVERLRQKISDLTVSGHQEYMRCEKMRGQLSEAQALLLELEGDHTLMLQMGASEFGPKECKTLRARLAKLRTYLRSNVLCAAETLAALSASAEPSVPVCDRCQGKGLYTLNGLCPKCGVSEFVAYKPSAPVERDGMTCMVDAAMAEMSNIHPPLKRSDCERLIRAALVGKA